MSATCVSPSESAASTARAAAALWLQRVRPSGVRRRRLLVRYRQARHDLHPLVQDRARHFGSLAVRQSDTHSRRVQRAGGVEIPDHGSRAAGVSAALTTPCAGTVAARASCPPSGAVTTCAAVAACATVSPTSARAVIPCGAGARCLQL